MGYGSGSASCACRDHVVLQGTHANTGTNADFHTQANRGGYTHTHDGANADRDTKGGRADTDTGIFAGGNCHARRAYANCHSYPGREAHWHIDRCFCVAGC